MAMRASTFVRSVEPRIPGQKEEAMNDPSDVMLLWAALAIVGLLAILVVAYVNER
jgi:hypothetical protein